MRSAALSPSKCAELETAIRFDELGDDDSRRLTADC